MYKKTTVTKESKEKQKFRQSAKWKKFRAFLKKNCKGTDYITQKKLYKGFSVHHKDMRIENYTNLTNPDRFLCCNKSTHEFLHFAYTYYQTDKDFINRLKSVLDDMCVYNTD